MDFLLDVQIAHNVTDSLTNRACDNDSICANNQCFALGSIFATSDCPISFSTNAQTHLDVVYSSREWHHESGDPHNPHVEEFDMCR